MTGRVTDVLIKIAEIEREVINPVSGSPALAYDNIPTTISGAQMPCFVNFPKNLASVEELGSGETGRENMEVRNYELRFFLSPAAGAEEEKSGLLTPWFELVIAQMGLYPHLKGEPEVVKARLLADMGTVQVPWADQHYIGTVFQLQVTRRVFRPYNESE
jgi:hypothetical protein